MFTGNWFWFKTDDDIIFECSDDNEINQVFGNVTCVNPRKRFINISIWIDNVLVVLTATVLLLNLIFCCCRYFLKETYEKTAQFCCDSCIDPQYYYKPWTIFPRGWFKLSNDFDFLLASLKFGLWRVFKTILIENIISQKFGKDLQKLAQGNYVAVANDIATYHVGQNFGSDKL